MTIRQYCCDERSLVWHGTAWRELGLGWHEGADDGHGHACLHQLVMLIHL